MVSMAKMGTRARQAGFAKLRALRCFPEIHERIRQAWPMTEVARWIQEDREEYTDVTRAGLLVVLRRYSASIPAFQKVEHRLPQAFVDAKERLEKGLDEINELEELYRLQMNRVKIDYEKEQQISKLFPTMSTEIREARNLLEALLKMKQELGLLKSAPQEHNVNITAEIEGQLTEDVAQFASEAMQGVLENPESRRRVTGVVDRFLRLSEKGRSTETAGTDEHPSG